MEIKEKNLVRISNFIKAEFEIALREEMESKKGFINKLCFVFHYHSFLIGFTKGMNYAKRHCEVLEEEENKK